MQDKTYPAHLWRLRVAKEFGKPLNDLLAEFSQLGHSINSTADIIGVSPHTLKAHCLAAGIEFKHKAQRPDRMPYKLSVQHNRHRLIEFNGERLPLGKWADKTGIHRRTIAHRLDVMGWPVDKAMTQPTGWYKPQGGRANWGNRKSAT